MFLPLSLLTRWARRRAWHGTQRWAGWWRSRLMQALSAPLQVGVLLQPEGWHVVLHEPGVPGLMASRASPTSPVRADESYRAWSPGTLPDLFSLPPGLPHGPVQADHLAAWRTALQSLQDFLPTGTCHLTLAWPDELLWSGAITLTGPLAESEVPSLLEQELSLVLPVPIDRVAWDARPIGLSAQGPSALAGWRAMLSRLRFRRQRTSFGRSERDVAWQCWAMPQALAQHISAVGRQLGWASVSIEPGSVSVQRATALRTVQADTGHLDASMSVGTTPEALAAWGAAHRQSRDVPDLLRDQRGGGLERCSMRVRGWWPWLLAWGLTAGAGYALGSVQQQRWAREHEAWTQRLRELHATDRARQASRQAELQARLRQQEQDARTAYNQRFAQVLQAWASTVPEGVRWQQLSMRPQFFELQAQALGAESFTRWMDQWPQALPAGGHHHLHWQPETSSAQQWQLPSRLGVRVQVSWNPLPKVRE